MVRPATTSASLSAVPPPPWKPPYPSISESLLPEPPVPPVPPEPPPPVVSSLSSYVPVWCVVVVLCRSPRSTLPPPAPTLSLLSCSAASSTRVSLEIWFWFEGRTVLLRPGLCRVEFSGFGPCSDLPESCSVLLVGVSVTSYYPRLILVSSSSLPNSISRQCHVSGPLSRHRLSLRLTNPVAAPFRLMVTLQLHPPSQLRSPADPQLMLALNLLLPESRSLPASPERPDPPDPPVFLLLSLSFVAPSSISPPPSPLLTTDRHFVGLVLALRMAPWTRALPQLFVSQSPSVDPPLFPPPQLAVDDIFIGFVRPFTALCRPLTEIFRLCSKFFMDSCVICWASLSWLFEGVLPTKSLVPELLVPSDNYCLFSPKFPLSLSGLVEQNSSVLQGFSSRFIVLPASVAGFFSALVADIFSGFSSESNALTSVSDIADKDIHGILVFFDSSCFLLIKCIYSYLVLLAIWLTKLWVLFMLYLVIHPLMEFY